MKNLAIASPNELPAEFEVATIDANQVTTLRAFYETMAKVFEFPDYFGFNLDSFDELINDLSWIENEKIAIYFTHSEQFLVNERNAQKIVTLLDLLDAACEEWKWVEEDKKELVILFSPSERIDQLLRDTLEA